jgi:serine/threonine protein kinase
VAIKEYFPEQFAVRHDDQTVAARLGDDHEEKFQWGLNRFLSEARTLAQFEHPNIVNVTRFFEANGTAYLVMKFEEGKDLQNWLENRQSHHQNPRFSQLFCHS